MSMSTSIIYGFGFICPEDKDSVLPFIRKHIHSLPNAEIIQHVIGDDHAISEDEWEGYFCSYECKSSGREGVGAVVSNIMSKETGIRFSYCSSDDCCDTKPAVLLEETMPWNFNEAEKNLSQDELISICKKYMEELGVSDDPEYLRQEYFG